MLFSLTFPVLAYLFFLTSCFTASVKGHPLAPFTRAIQSQYSNKVPVETSRTSLQRRGLPGAVYICTDQNFRGNCAWIMPSNACHIPGTGDLAPESIGPDPGGFCALYAKADCTGNQITTFRFPGLASGTPQFAGLKCYADGQGLAANETSIVQNGGAVGSGILPAGGEGIADPRLAGGEGSAERLRLKGVMKEMDFTAGMIGLRKGHYY